MSASHRRRPLENLVLACAGCNHEKGRRHVGDGRTPRSVEVVTRLVQKRRARLRPTVPVLNPGYRRR